MNCHCGLPLQIIPGYRGGISSTLVGYYSPPGHDHDDNCLKREYTCEAGHSTFLSVQNKCSAPGCDWIGKLTCFCHRGEKLKEWPVLAEKENERG